MKNILLATDFSGRSHLALLRAREIARRTGAALTLAHVVDADQPEGLVDMHIVAAGAVLAAMEEEGEEEGRTEEEIETRHVVLKGEVFWALRQAALDRGADLIIAGGHRRSWLRDAFRDTTIERLARVAPVPVLVARNPDPSPPDASPWRHAVVGIESDEGARLAEVVAALGRAAPAAVTLVHAFDPVAAGTLVTSGASRDEVADYRREMASRARERIGRNMPPVWRDLPVEAIEGDAIAALEGAARRLGADLVVTSTHARRGLDRLILGSVSAHFIRQGVTDFLLVPAAAAD
jgi:nucleotide-binding universal stress UspA family protein